MDAKRKIEEENEISIPFSTIKSMTGLYNHIIRRLFQFHLVRLKEHHPVSENPVHAFQFHLVRLKGNKRKDDGCKSIQFQFHLVRLKV